MPKGAIIGPPLVSALKRLVGNVAVQGVPYTAQLLTNLILGGTDPLSISIATKVFNQAHSQCPKSIIVAGGYSQGAALMHRTISRLPSEIKDQIAAVVTYGDTQNALDLGAIPNFPRNKVKVFCNIDDGVCGGALLVNAGHLSYLGSIQPGAQFLAQGIQAAQSGGTVNSGSTGLPSFTGISGITAGTLTTGLNGLGGGLGGLFGL